MKNNMFGRKKEEPKRIDFEDASDEPEEIEEAPKKQVKAPVEKTEIEASEYFDMLEGSIKRQWEIVSNIRQKYKI